MRLRRKPIDPGGLTPDSAPRRVEFVPGAARMDDPPFLLGLSVPSRTLPATLAAREAQIGRAADVVLVFARIGDPVSDVVPRLMAAGYEVALCLEWWRNTSKLRDPAFALREISAGKYDIDATRWFQSFRDLPRPVHLRPLHEGNSNWYPWGVYNKDNSVADYIPAFQRIAHLARDTAADKVLLQWCVNCKNSRGGSEPLTAFYAGDDCVDEFVVNGFNRPGTANSDRFDDVIGPAWRAMKAISPTTPIWVGETACTETYGDKAEWITAMFDVARTTLPLDCLTYFDIQKTIRGEPVRDWPIDTSPAALAAFAAGAQMR